jgi:integrase
MARKPQVGYWPTRGTWTDAEGQTQHGSYCCTFRGKQHTLAVGPEDAPEGPTYGAALRAFGQLVTLGSVSEARDRSPCRALIEHYLRNVEEKGSANTLRIRQIDLAAFCETEMADWPVGKLTRFAVEDWLRRMRKPRAVDHPKRGGGTVRRVYRWGDTRVRMALSSLNAVLNWAVKAGLIPVNPIKGIETPAGRSRSRDCVLSPADHQRVLEAARGQLRELVVCLESTGCRPGELLTATAADWDDRLGALVFYADTRRQAGEKRHKIAGKDKDRRIFFAGEALDIMRRRVRRYPRGPLWRASQGPDRPLAVRLRRPVGALGTRGQGNRLLHDPHHGPQRAGQALARPHARHPVPGRLRPLARPQGGEGRGTASAAPPLPSQGDDELPGRPAGQQPPEQRRFLRRPAGRLSPSSRYG